MACVTCPYLQVLGHELPLLRRQLHQLYRLRNQRLVHREQSLDVARLLKGEPQHPQPGAQQIKVDGLLLETVGQETYEVWVLQGLLDLFRGGQDYA